jgi:hypothetical protein
MKYFTQTRERNDVSSVPYFDPKFQQADEATHNTGK